MGRLIKKKAVICDIDGVLLDTKHIFDRIEEKNLSEAEKWDYFNRHANDYDVEADPRFVDILETLSTDYRIVFMTARSAEIYKHTRAKIAQSIGLFATTVFDYLLCMRDINDKRTSVEVKADLLKEVQEQFDIVFAIDDDPANCEMFAQNGIVALQVLKK